MLYGCNIDSKVRNLGISLIAGVLFESNAIEKNRETE